MMLHTKYQGSRSYGFRQADFVMFSLHSLCKTCDPQNRAILAQGHNLNKLGRYQGSRPCGFRQEGFFMFSLYKHM